MANPAIKNLGSHRTDFDLKIDTQFIYVSALADIEEIIRGYGEILNKPGLTGEYRVRLEADGEWDLCNKYRDLIGELQSFSGMAEVKAPEKPEIELL